MSEPNTIKPMGRQRFFKLLLFPAPLLLSFFSGGVSSAAAQSAYPVCQPPKAGEYLLLVVSPTPESQNRVRRALPPDTSTVKCQYFNDTVTRIGGFTQISAANAQAQYINNTVGLSTFVAQGPPETEAQNPPSYNPKNLASGYAVLVDYFNRPEVATQVRQLLGRAVGLASYGRRPYLLAIHTTSQNTANLTLQTLSEHGFFALLVDSRKVTVLRSVVSSQ